MTSETIYPNAAGRFKLWGVVELIREDSIAFCVHLLIWLYQEVGLNMDWSIRIGAASTCHASCSL